MAPINLFHDLTPAAAAEQITSLLDRPGLRIERIVSTGQVSPEGFWYDQDDHEWVVILRGRGTVAFDGGTEVELAAGDALNIPAHQRHRVTFTDPDELTVWLAVHYA